MHVRLAASFLLAALAMSACSGSNKTREAKVRGTVAGYKFVSAPASLLDKCKSTARSVGYAVPCPTRIPTGLVAFGGTSDCSIDIIGPGKHCPQTVISWRGWVVGSSVAGPIGDQHLVVTASPHRLRDYAKVVNGPAWRRGERVRPLGWLTINGRRMREVFVPPETNVGTAFASHIVLIWSMGDHTYAFGFHKVSAEVTPVSVTQLLAKASGSALLLRVAVRRRRPDTAWLRPVLPEGREPRKSSWPRSGRTFGGDAPGKIPELADSPWASAGQRPPSPELRARGGGKCSRASAPPHSQLAAAVGEPRGGRS